ncbi:hypothetical protein AHF37_07490 [Paragonimus kellicotti]|nr:hypothetical protein AHF37_07490 [Paragonimus kellicotti]
MILNRVELQSNEGENEEEEDFEVVDSVWQVNVDCEKLVRNASNSIFLFDHAWTFELSSLRTSLIALPSLRLRMAELMDIDQSELDETTVLDRICERVWKFCRYYKVSLQGQGGQPRHDPEVQRWYVLDEVGCRISHSDYPNVVSLCITWKSGQILMFSIYSANRFCRYYKVSLQGQGGQPRHDPEVQRWYVLDEVGCRISHSDYPNGMYLDFGNDFRIISNGLMRFGNRTLSLDPRNQLINQFPGEQVITVKDLLAAIASLWASTQHGHVDGDLPLEKKLTCDWYPVTFNLVHELPSFVAYFQRQQQRLKQPDSVQTLTACTSPSCCRRQTVANGGDATEKAYNVWILKPWNLGRGLGICVTDNLDQIIRMCDTNPLIASRYVTDPVLFYRDDIQANVKFDVRYVVLLRSVQPLRLYVYNVFWLRFANRPFCLDNFGDYGTHFTVMNYREDDPLKQVSLPSFSRIVPFFYTPRGVCYSLLWPLRDLQRGEAITVDYIEHIKDLYLRQFYLIPWQPEDFSELPIEHCFILSETFFQSHRVQETLPCFSGATADPLVPTQAHPLLVYSDIALVRQHLTDPRFKLVDSSENAKLLWLYDHFKDFK